MQQRVLFLDGLRGVLAVIVFVHHYFYLFCPEIIFGGSSEIFQREGAFSINKLIALTPINIIFNPGFAIQFFFLLSGYVQTQKYFQTRDITIIQKGILKRYFRLALPVLSVVILVYISHRFMLIRKDLVPQNPLNDGWLQSMLPNTLNIPGVFKEGLLSCFQHNSRYYQILWTMPTELINSFLVLGLALLLNKLKHQTKIILAVMLVQLFFLDEYYSVAFVTGMLIAHLQQTQSLFNKVLSMPAIKLLCFIIGIYFGSYPFTGYQNATAHSFYAPISFFDKYPHIISFYIGTTFLFCFLLYSSLSQKVFSLKPFLFFGRISFMFYLTHFLLLLTLSPLIFSKMHGNIAVSAVLSFVVVTLGAWLLTILIDQPVIKWSNKFASLFFKSEHKI